ncbi:hypothetical protein LCGC14_2760840, partial [marine sediment metagenome]
EYVGLIPSYQFTYKYGEWFGNLNSGEKNAVRYYTSTGYDDISDYLRKLIIHMAKNNKHVGCRKFHGYLKYLGIKVSPATISRVLREHGIEPCPDRPGRTSWNEFVRVHWESLAAIDFFSTEIYTLKELVRYMVLVVIDYKTRKVEIAGIIPQAYPKQ